MIPIVGALLKSGLGLVAKAVLAKGKDFVALKTGVNLDEETLSDESILKLREFEATHAEELLKLQIEDTKSAREKEVALATSAETPLLNKLIAPILALGTIVLAFGLFYAMMFLNMGANNEKIALYLLGVLSSITIQIYGYYFGSSSGSAEKNKTITGFLGGVK
ncbi:MAG: hypothetical protein WC623_24330 [Pedobacter sp.]|uniref:hypothetical protein n=1 Tax=Pedobacter sp. TaxID=1411316 RepID=UPI003567667B